MVKGGTTTILALLALTACSHRPLAAQPPQAPTRRPAVDVAQDRTVTFRIVAPRATQVRLVGSDLPGLGAGVAMTKDESGVWEASVGPVAPGAYRYQFLVDGVATLDPRNPATSESLGNSWSLIAVPGAEWMDAKNVPHGAVASVHYHSTALGKLRRMHVYTPPGYEKGKGNYPVFYLLHGAGDCDDSWTSVGRAGFILDNLIAAGKARPMIVVMPAGHTRPMGGPGGALSGADEFVQDFVKDIRPTIERQYRVKTDRGSRAIAGLSMGGFQTLNIAAAQLADFGYVGVFSSGLFGIVPMGRPGQPAATASGPFPWEEQNKAVLSDPQKKKGLKLFWLACGTEDFLFATHRATAALFERYGFPVTNRETDGGHTWLKWRDYLIEFAPQLFR